VGGGGKGGWRCEREIERESEERGTRIKKTRISSWTIAGSPGIDGIPCGSSQQYKNAVVDGYE
jgi:hypothetical protein